MPKYRVIASVELDIEAETEKLAHQAAKVELEMDEYKVVRIESVPVETFAEAARRGFKGLMEGECKP